MDKFETILMKFGEHGIQAILENWERHQGVCPVGTMTLEARWETFLRETNDNVARIAA